MLRLLIMLLCLATLPGCYYMQAAKGQWELTRKRQPIEEVLASEDTSPELAARLRLVQEARQFAVDELGLPDNDTYRTYADIERDYVVWNVFAAPEFSMRPKTWCFPIVGCVSYRGYFARDDAEREAQRLEQEGFDVAVGGVAAYSTLGKLRDPVLNTMMNWDDVQLVSVLFHELAHQVLYVKDDTAFNESFATAVEEFAMLRWLSSRGLQSQKDEYLARRRLRQELMDLVAAARSDLQAIYTGDVAVEEKRAAKSARFEALRQAVDEHLESAGRKPGSWLAGELNNARLVSMSLYEGRLPEFRALLASCDDDLACFYEEARNLAGR
jgi:predicted aminopeptidase